MNHKPSCQFYAELLHRILVGMMAWPSKLVVSEEETPQKVMIGVQCHGDDKGQVIGKQATRIQALKTIFRAIAERQGDRVDITVAESTTPPPASRPNMLDDPNWDKDQLLVNLASDIICEFASKSFTVKPVSAGGKTVLIVNLNEPIKPDLFEAVANIMTAWGRLNGRKVEIQLAPHDTAHA